jgi:PAS domain S-box-containing protein
MPFYRRFFEISFDMMCVCNATHFLDVNEAMCKLLGYTRGELLSRTYYEFMHPDDVEISRAEVAKGRRGTFFENRYITKAGKIVWLRWTSHENVDGDNVVHCVAKDITAEKIIANQLGKFVIDIQRSERAAKQAKEEAETMAYAASHDLQEPLRTIMNWAAFLRDDYGDLLPEEGKEQLQYILEGATRGRELVMDLLQLSRVGRDASFAWVDMNTIVDKAVTDVEFQVRETQAEIGRDNLPSVWGDASMLRLLVKNLLSNAMKFAKPGDRPTVHVTSELSDAAWIFRVRDNGIGIDPVYAQKIFGVFARLNPKSPGTGIGLAICQKIVKMHDGNIWIEPSPGSGATVSFTVSRTTPGTTNDEQNPQHPAGGGSRTGREDDAEGVSSHRDSPPTSLRLGRLGGVAILAAGGALRDRPSRRPGLARSQPAESVGVRGSRGGEK